MANRTLRLDEQMDTLVRIAAAAQGKSVHAWILDAIRGQLLQQARTKAGAAIAAALDAAAGRKA